MRIKSIGLEHLRSDKGWKRYLDLGRGSGEEAGGGEDEDFEGTRKVATFPDVHNGQVIEVVHAFQVVLKSALAGGGEGCGGKRVVGEGRVVGGGGERVVRGEGCGGSCLRFWGEKGLWRV